MSALGAMLYRESKIRGTNLTYMVWDLMHPLANLLFFGAGMDRLVGMPLAVAGHSYPVFFLPGVLGMACMVIASNTAWGFFMDRDNGIFYEQLTYPLSRGEFLVGKMTFNAAVVLAESAVTIAAGWWLFGLRVPAAGWAPLLAGIVASTAGWFFFFAVLALRIRRNDAFNAVTSTSFMLLPASSLFYPLAAVPGWLRHAALANPITWSIDFLRACTLGTGFTPMLAAEAAAFLAFGGAAFLLATRSLRNP
ncbi:MAG TPA: ABC transporter permease [Candidatus Acidoferrales bacterium]|nr:ABC transporter permease [Candidatus Acidoferrales bacterium]